MFCHVGLQTAYSFCIHVVTTNVFIFSRVFILCLLLNPFLCIYVLDLLASCVLCCSFNPCICALCCVVLCCVVLYLCIVYCLLRCTVLCLLPPVAGRIGDIRTRPLTPLRYCSLSDKYK